MKWGKRKQARVDKWVAKRRIKDARHRVKYQAKYKDIGRAEASHDLLKKGAAMILAGNITNYVVSMSKVRAGNFDPTMDPVSAMLGASGLLTIGKGVITNIGNRK